MHLASARTVEEITAAMNAGKLPQALLFAGPRYSGRLTTALDLAFAMSGDADNRRTLSADNVVFLPERNLEPPLRASYRMLSEHPCDRYRYFFIENVRIVMMQYHPALQSQGRDQKDRIFERAGDLDAMLMDFAALSVEDRHFLPLAEKMMDIVSKDEFLYKGRKKGGISVDDIRFVQSYVAVGEKLKFIILENVEQSTDAGRNALLKVLEEPPKGAYFILLSENPQRIIPTILSRVRKFSFPAPTKEHLNSCLKERFLTEKDYDGMDEFFYEKMFSPEDRQTLAKSAEEYLELMISGAGADAGKLNAILLPLDRTRGLDYFLSLVSKGLEKAYESGRLSAYETQRRMKLLSRMTIAFEVYNQNARVGLDLALREA